MSAPAGLAHVVLVTAWLCAGQSPRPLVFCAATDSLPMSARGGGFEVDIARAVAAHLNRDAAFEWLEPHDGNAGQALLEDRCDAAPGFVVDPGAMAGGGALPGLALSVPYYTAGYVMIRGPRTRPVRSLEDVADARVAVEGESVPVFTLRQRGYQVRVVPDSRAVVDAVAEGRAAYGYLWGPLTGSLLRGRKDVVLAEEFTPVDRWDFAMAVRQDRRQLRDQLSAAILALRGAGQIDKILRQYGIRLPRQSVRRGGRSPYRGVFSTAGARGTIGR